MNTYMCDGMPTGMGCGAEITPTRPFTYPHRARKSEWMTVPNRNEDGADDQDLLLHFCPTCASIVRQQERNRR